MASHVSVTRNQELDECLETIWSRVPDLEDKLTDTVIQALISYSGGGTSTVPLVSSASVVTVESEPDDEDDWDDIQAPVVSLDDFEQPPDDDNDDEW